MTKTETRKVNSALSQVNRCSGDCKVCPKFYVETAGYYYAYSCQVAKDAGYRFMSDSIKDLKQETVEGLRFELS